MQQKLIYLMSIAAAVAIVAPATAASKERTPEGSFLRYRANTVVELKRQIATDSVVQARYAAHFDTNSKQLLATINSGVKLVSLKAPAKVDMWYVSSKGKVSHKTKLLPKGSQVFATRDGKPFLAWSCGNPLTAKALPQPRVVAAAKAPKSKDVVNVKVAPAPPEVVTSLAIAAPPALVTEVAPALAVAEPTLSLPSLIAATPPSISLIAPVATNSGGGIYNLGWLAGLGALASRSSGSSPAPPVPEPSSVLALAAGVSSAMALGGKRLLRGRK